MHNVSATILSCNTAYLGNMVLAAEAGGADSLHIDITEGEYCGNYSFGPKTVSDLSNVVNIPLDVHLEIKNAQYYIDLFADAGANIITIQSDGCTVPFRAMQEIKKRGIRAGIGVSPSVSTDTLIYYMSIVDQITLLSVEPGFGGQKLNSFIYPKIKDVRRMIDESKRKIELVIDGGVNSETAPLLLENGVDTLIIGSCVFKDNNVTVSEIEEGMRYYKNL